MNFAQLYRAVDHILANGHGAIKGETPVRVYLDDEAYREVVGVYSADMNGRLVVIIRTGDYDCVDFDVLLKSMDRILDYGSVGINDETPVRIFLDNTEYREVVAVYPEDHNERLITVIKAGY